MMFSQRVIKNMIYQLILLILVILAIGCMKSDKEKSEISSDSSSTNKWFQGGNLHNASIEQWENATDQNKLATAADWLASTNWKGFLNSMDDFDKIKSKAEMLVNSVDEVITANKMPTMKVNEIAAALITMSNDLGP